MSELKNKFEGLKYGVARIRTVSFMVNESLYVNDPTKEIKAELAQIFGIDVDANFIDFRLRVYLFYEGKREQLLTDIVVQNVFKIENLKQYCENEQKIVLPPTLIINIISLSVTHARALLCQNLAGTFLQEFVFPITNAVDVAKAFYPNMFDENGVMKEETEFMLTPKIPRPQ